MADQIQYQYTNDLECCPNCGARLESKDIKCKYCDINLIGYNKQNTMSSTFQEYESINEEKNSELRIAIETKRNIYTTYYRKMRKYKIIDALLIPTAVIGIFYFFVLVTIV